MILLGDMVFNSLKTAIQIDGVVDKIKFGVAYFVYVISKRKINLFPNMTVKLFGSIFSCRNKTSDYWHVSNTYEPETTKFLKEIKTGVFIDVGAHIGRYSVLLSKNFDRIIAFEPLKANYVQLLKNHAINDITKNMLIQKALSDKNCKSLIHANPENLGNSSLDGASGTPEKVECIKLDDALKQLKILNKKVSVIKIDVEGWEMHVLKGASKLLKSCSPVLVIECFEHLNGVKLFLKKYGYSLTKTLDKDNYVFLKN